MPKYKQEPKDTVFDHNFPTDEQLTQALHSSKHAVIEAAQRRDAFSGYVDPVVFEIIDEVCYWCMDNVESDQLEMRLFFSKDIPRWIKFFRELNGDPEPYMGEDNSTSIGRYLSSRTFIRKRGRYCGPAVYSIKVMD